nr:hypothetical protein Itr_chr13CG04760 [Ipomoea trifida]
MPEKPGPSFDEDHTVESLSEDDFTKRKELKEIRIRSKKLPSPSPSLVSLSVNGAGFAVASFTETWSLTAKLCDSCKRALARVASDRWCPSTTPPPTPNPKSDRDFYSYRRCSSTSPPPTPIPLRLPFRPVVLF